MNLKESANVWEIWLQGHKAAPPLARFWSESLDKNILGANMIRFGLDEAMRLVGILSGVVTRWESGQIGHSGLTDILRIGLFANHGGIWSDSSIFLSAPLTLLETPAR